MSGEYINPEEAAVARLDGYLEQLTQHQGLIFETYSLRYNAAYVEHDENQKGFLVLETTKLPTDKSISSEIVATFVIDKNSGIEQAHVFNISNLNNFVDKLEDHLATEEERE